MGRESDHYTKFRRRGFTPKEDPIYVKRMKKEEIIPLLVEDYEWAIEECKSLGYESLRAFLDEQELDRGVCRAARKRHGVNLAEEEWVTRNCVDGFGYAYWFECPNDLRDKEKILESLEHRLRILQRELRLHLNCKQLSQR